MSSGDFIRVLQGDLWGKEGFVKHCNDPDELVVEETSKDPGQPLVTYEGGYPMAPTERVCGWSHCFSPAYSFQPDDIYRCYQEDVLL
jgi:hypothetical protein